MKDVYQIGMEHFIMFIGRRIAKHRLKRGYYREGHLLLEVKRDTFQIRGGGGGLSGKEK